MAQGKCANCEETDIRLFEFAHFHREDKTISTHQSLSAVREEFKKGRWLCVWCHRKETYEENKVIYPHTISSIHRSKSKQYIDDIKLKIRHCQICNKIVDQETVSFFEFDHLNPSTKLNAISDLIGYNKSIIDNEIIKCRLLCCKCHRLHTIQQAHDRKKEHLFNIESDKCKPLMLNVINSAESSISRGLTLNIIKE